MPHDLPELSLIICTLDESASIGRVLDEVRDVLSGEAFEILVVDDSADDRTVAAVREAARGDARIRIVRRDGERGLASAAILGWRHARGRVLGIMDGDGQHDASLLTRLLQQVRDGADLAVASRFAPSASLGLSGMRRVISTAGTGLVQLVLGARTTDPLAGFFMMRRDWFEAAAPRLTGIGFKILVDLLVSGKRRPVVAEVSTSLRPRLGGESKLDLRVLIELLAQLVERRSRGLIKARFMMFVGVGASGLAIHATALTLLNALLPFSAAQAGAILTAMVWNYVFNNLLTFRDLRLRGGAFWRGMAAFMLACLGGAVISEGVAVGLNALDAHWLGAGMLGAVLAAAWNYLSASRAAWGLGARPAAPSVTVEGAVAS